ncbi:MAG: bifunctional metallophosphatase/5'-nucleotidase [Paludibacteraceae bacterium]|nr:bifunctional metallophosphatase/5'-nucleotidase [Paludibacteraceae bacterium]
MKKRIVISTLFSFLLSCLLMAHSNDNKILILSVNDMHASFEKLPRLKHLADSLRCLYPNMLVLSAGDNRTGNPFSDQYPTASLPMTELMNYVGFDASAIGNHDFDAKVNGFIDMIKHSHFPYLSANVELPDSLKGWLKPYQTFTMRNGLRVGVLSLLQLNDKGIPDTDPNNVEGVRFLPAMEAIEQYRSLREECDVLLMLTHLGYEVDLQIAEKYANFADIIVGGHSHTKIDGGVTRNGVLITQAENKLKYATVTTIETDGKKITRKKAELVDLGTIAPDKGAEALVKLFSENDELNQVIGQLADSIQDEETMGGLMGQSWIGETQADFAVINNGNVRITELPAGDIHLADVFRIDPYDNDVILLELTGEELKALLLACQRADDAKFPFLIGAKYEAKVNPKDSSQIERLTLKHMDGKRFDMKKTYKVVTSSYVMSISKFQHRCEAQKQGMKCNALMIQHVKRVKHITRPKCDNVTTK